MIDIHCHILPGIDDGAKNVEDSLIMAKEAVKEGIHTIIATPHLNSQYDNRMPSILTKVDELNRSLQEANISMRILPGQEPRIFGEILADLESGDIQTLNDSQYLFIEFPSSHVPRYTEKLLFDIQVKGLTPIIVHPERNAELIERPETLYKLVEKGALTQVTASSLCGYFGKKIKNYSMQLIEANQTHFIASDAHNVVNRTFKMDEAFSLVESKFGMDYVYLFKENAELLIEKKNIIKEIPVEIKKKKKFLLF
ncbi:tyrosine protein phosphatase [Neobacillus sp. MM2021_6]|uniref:tyrosine-protein phosphatase n=1 Tax=Bacillaceae TaxID=186817 RepID=UPI0014085719|nr:MULTISPECIES: CpsB/CapC family capsule biosynthesis tyrosine phosphatase [Bacillaceae]MBO0961032.1 tyrosine protein phosphatase [Neobacillus sp. MM2021_6]NHC19056.1 tyrosine protein phosphatase [Bacillus sp. MM2020_4]